VKSKSNYLPFAKLSQIIRHNHGRPQGGGQNGHFPRLEIETKNENFPEKLKSAAQFRSIDLILAMAVYVPV